jgi:molybdopterin/thiamine biosynthesis adenylyltransferase
MTYSVAMTGDVETQLLSHLIRKDGQEDLCFALWRPSRGATRLSGLVVEPVLPLDGERHVHGTVSFESRYFLRAAGLAAAQESGLAVLHTHPGAVTWQRMSLDDERAESSIAAQTLVLTRQPLLGMTLGSGKDVWSGRYWVKSAPRTYSPVWCNSVRTISSSLRVSWNPELCLPPVSGPRQLRTVSAWGSDAQADLARLHVGVVGLGSVGSMVAEALARLGIASLTLIDFDTLREHNLDRFLGGTVADLGRAKVAVAKRQLERHSTADEPVIEALEYSIVEEGGYRASLDCDVLFSCVDRPWPRSVLNLIAYAHLIPVVDGGIAVQAGSRGLKGAHWRAHIAAPGRKCLECLRQYDPGLIQTERDGYLDDPKYIEDLPEDHELKRNENVFPFSMSTASFEVLQFLRMVLAPSGISDVGGDDYQFVLSEHKRDVSSCSPNCYFSGQLLARGDALGWAVTGDHAAAARARYERAPTTVQLGTEVTGTAPEPTPPVLHTTTKRLNKLKHALVAMLRGLMGSP